MVFFGLTSTVRSPPSKVVTFTSRPFALPMALRSPRSFRRAGTHKDLETQRSLGYQKDRKIPENTTNFIRDQIQIIAPKPQRKSFLRGNNVPFYLIYLEKTWKNVGFFSTFLGLVALACPSCFLFCLAMFCPRRTSRACWAGKLATTNNFWKHQSWHTLTFSCPPWEKLLINLLAVGNLWHRVQKLKKGTLHTSPRPTSIPFLPARRVTKSQAIPHPGLLESTWEKEKTGGKFPRQDHLPGKRRVPFF